MPDCLHARLKHLDTPHGPRGWRCEACGHAGPTMVRADDDGPTWRRVTALCVCGDGWAWDSCATGEELAAWLAKHAGCEVPGV